MVLGTRAAARPLSNRLSRLGSPGNAPLGIAGKWNMAANRVALVALTIVALLAGGCSGGRDVATADAVVAETVMPTLPMETAVVVETDVAEVTLESGAVDTAMGGVVMATPAPGVVGSVAEANREVITTGDVSIRSEDPVASAAEVVRIVEAVGGRIDARNEQRPTDTFEGSAWLQVRIPAGQVNNVIDQLNEVGEVTDVGINRQDVTATGQDLDARIAALETSTERLRELLARSATTRDLLEIERELAVRQADLDGLRAQRAALSDQVAMSTLNVNISPTATAPRHTPRGFLGGLASGWRALSSFGRGLLVVLGAVLPWLVLLAALVLIGRLLWRWLRRRLALRSGATSGLASTSAVGRWTKVRRPSEPNAPRVNDVETTAVD